jgi:hypothetical protein
MAKVKLTDEQVAALLTAIAKELTEMLEEYEVTKKIIDKGKRFADQGLDLVETFYQTTPNKIDDAILGPICAGIRASFNIPEYNT